VRVGAMAADMAIKQGQHNEFGVPEFPIDLRIDGVWREGATVRTVTRPKRKGSSLRQKRT